MKKTLLAGLTLAATMASVQSANAFNACQLHSHGGCSQPVAERRVTGTTKGEYHSPNRNTPRNRSGPSWYGNTWNNVIDRGIYVSCGRNTNQVHCPSSILTLGRSKCQTQQITFGPIFGFPADKVLSGLSLNGAVQFGWQTCSIRNISVSCPGRPGKSVRPATATSTRNAEVKYLQAINNFSGFNTTVNHWDHWRVWGPYPRFRHGYCESRNV